MKAYLLVFICCFMGTACTGASSTESVALPTLNSERAIISEDVVTTVPEALPVVAGVEAEPTEVPASAETSPDEGTDEVDLALQEVDEAICREIAEAQVELAALIDQGQDIEELTVAMTELADEFESCGIQLESSE